MNGLLRVKAMRPGAVRSASTSRPSLVNVAHREEDPADGYAEPRPLPPGQRRAATWRPNHYGRVPRIDLATWSLTVSGATAGHVDRTLSWADLEPLPRIEVVADHHCVSRSTVQDVRWGGIPCGAVLDLVEPADEARYAIPYGSYGYSSIITIDDLLSPRSIFATHLDGELLPPEHGWPMRLVVPHLYGWKGPKWLIALEFCVEPRRGFWEQRGYHFTGDVWREERYAHQE